MSRMSELPEVPASENPRRWRFTWEAQSHIPILRLFVFNPNVKPLLQCNNLKINLPNDQSILTLSWVEDGKVDTSLTVPVPRVLTDVESPPQFKVLDDHIEVKLVLLLPVDHPIISSLDSVLDLNQQNARNSDYSQPLSVDSDLKNLSSSNGIHFYCRNCSTKLTSFLRLFEEIPSVNWREVADNWFGTCCCSFGGISERLVTSYAKSYASPKGVCLLSMTSAIIHVEDLLEFKSFDWIGCQNNEIEHSSDENNFQVKAMLENGIDHAEILCCESHSEKMHAGVNDDSLSGTFTKLDISKNEAMPEGYCDVKNIWNCHAECCTPDAVETSSKDQRPDRNTELQENQRIFLNGYLGDGFMSRSSNLSKDVQWIELLCPKCSGLLGAYATIDGSVPADARVRLFKCYISTCVPVEGHTDLFRNYTLERVLTNQLLESAKDELSFRTVVRDLQTRSPLLQIVLLNPNVWCCSGYCCHTSDKFAKINMYPFIKVLFSDCKINSESQLRMIEQWAKKNQADEVYTFASQIKQLILSLECLNNVFPQSHNSFEGFFLSSLRR